MIPSYLFLSASVVSFIGQAVHNAQYSNWINVALCVVCICLAMCAFDLLFRNGIVGNE